MDFSYNGMIYADGWVCGFSPGNSGRGAHKEQEVSYEDSHGADIRRKRNPRVFHL
jgi:hypothetical protein